MQAHPVCLSQDWKRGCTTPEVVVHRVYTDVHAGQKTCGHQVQMATVTERLTVLRQRRREGEQRYGFYLYARGRGFSPGVSRLAGTESAHPPRAMGGG